MKILFLSLLFLLTAVPQTQAQTPVIAKTVKVPQDTVRKYRISSDYFAAVNPTNRKVTLYVNREITTFIVTGDRISLIDISVPGKEVAGNQPGDNIVRLKPLKDCPQGAELGVVSIVTERCIIQFNLRYVEDPLHATTQYNCTDEDGVSYLNPSVDMTRAQLYEYAWRIRNSRDRFYDVSSINQKMRISLNNIYTVGNYFFIDFSLKNQTKIQFDIEEIRVKLCDKKVMKAVNNQEIEITPTLVLDETKSFKRHYRNVIVLPKFTFPDEKVLTITVSEEPITGRTISLNVDYADILNADSFHSSLY